MLIELLECLAAPPGLQVSGSVVPPPVIIEGVAELVADGEADPAVVENRRAASLVEGVLENTQRQNDLVHHGGVVSVDGLRGGLPGVPGDGSSQSGEHSRRGILLTDIFQQRFGEAAVFFGLRVQL